MNDFDWRTKEWLTEYYINRGMSYADIAKIVGRSKRAVILAAKQFGIKSRSQSETKRSKFNKCKQIDEDDIIRLYQNGYSIGSIANRLDISKCAVRNRLTGIEMRNHSDSRMQI